MILLYGKPLAEQVQRAIARRTKTMRKKPLLAVVLVGKNPASVNYVQRKGTVARIVGCGFQIYSLPSVASKTRVIKLIERLNANEAVNGIIVQLPLPGHIDTEAVLAAIAPHKDVDNLRGDSPFVSPSVQAVWHMLQKAARPKKNTRILVVGYGRLIGKPLHAFLLKKGFANVAVADKKTRNLTALCKQANVLVSAVGKPGLITNVKKGAVLIDAGAGLKKGKIKGDVDVASISKQARIATPVPGGVGPLTVVYLFKNLISRL